jgi:hypothetical protein
LLLLRPERGSFDQSINLALADANRLIDRIARRASAACSWPLAPRSSQLAAGSCWIFAIRLGRQPRLVAASALDT